MMTNLSDTSTWEDLVNGDILLETLTHQIGVFNAEVAVFLARKPLQD